VIDKAARESWVLIRSNCAAKTSSANFPYQTPVADASIDTGDLCRDDGQA